MLSRHCTLASLVVALVVAGCGARSAVSPLAGQSVGSSTGVAATARATTTRAATGGTTTDRAATAQATTGRLAPVSSKWTIDDLSRAEGRKLYAKLQQGDLTVAPDLTPGEKAILEKLFEAPPGTSVKDQDVAPDHLKRIKMQGEFVYQHDGPYHRAMWRMEDARGKTLGFRVHSQPSDLMSGKYIVAFYGADAHLLFASPIWY